MPPSKSDYAKINIACKELGLDKHQLLTDRYRLESSKQLSAWQLTDLYKHFRSLGWQVKRSRDSKLTPKYDSSIQRKVVAMWITLHRTGVIRNSSDRALQAYVKRVVKVDNLKWCGGEDCRVLIESLKAWGVRNGVEFG